jgi:formylglycine-generating enzyme required for sulfatase activity
VTVDEKQRVFGDEARALALALLAWEKARSLGPDARAAAGDTLAWAWFASGKDDDALARSREAREVAPPERKGEFAMYLEKLERAIAAAQAEGERVLAALTERIDALTAEVESGRSLPFADEADRFLHDALASLLADLAAFERDAMRDVERRVAWAERVQELSIDRHARRWQEARAAIAAADQLGASERYREVPVDLQPQMGLVPIGMNPVTKLWEFYELSSAEDPTSIPQHEADGSIEVTAGTGIVLVLLPGGSFWMGAQPRDPQGKNHDPQARPDEWPVHEVSLSPFFIARYEITQAQWSRLSGGDAPSLYQPPATPGGHRPVSLIHPVENVSWQMCSELLDRHGLSLPTEAQWEYACRAGSESPWSCELDQFARHGNVADATAASLANWNCEAWRDGHIVHAPVGTFAPNAFGLFDMHGNVLEWTRDGYDAYGATPRPGDGLRGDPYMLPCVYRGGSYNDAAASARSARRARADQTVRGNNQGLRAARKVME